MPAVPPPERGCERPPGLLRAPLAAQRAWLGLAIVGRNALGRQHSTPGPGGMCRVTGGSGKRLPQQERHGEAPGSQEEASGRGEPHPANVQEQLQACWGRCQAGGRARAGDRVRGGAAGSLCDPGQRASLPGACFYPQRHRHYQTEVPSGSEDDGCQLAPPASLYPQSWEQRNQSWGLEVCTPFS